ncbi:hypothetical protein NHX12_028551 [Muraenolepis orangiensis]|uniref:Uncharacterized protein n=1 Tax=Muraenolepis orangiensis TaxID=630683 RepID=A0A9Q0EAS7_9TELE|nr:hypothetical protein NHX12_028551 [Muraenolepis orangiensis]
MTSDWDPCRSPCSKIMGGKGRGGGGRTNVAWSHAVPVPAISMYNEAGLEPGMDGAAVAVYSSSHHQAGLQRQQIAGTPRCYVLAPVCQAPEEGGPGSDRLVAQAG